jgi:hypothetical protein
VDEHNTVLTVPLDFDANQRKIATKAAEAAGFKVVQVRNFFYFILTIDHFGFETPQKLHTTCNGAQLCSNFFLESFFNFSTNLMFNSTSSIAVCLWEHNFV